MIDHYNAFISYRHAPLDIKVAEHIHSKLEHFHIPAKIRKQTGMKRIQRIFRDKDELPLTSDLTDTISHALENSDYLIVICSKSTNESEWVKREIQYFLKTHSRNHILAVLAEGEPYEVLPEELLKEEVTVVNADGTKYSYIQDKEPLCCEYRQSFRKADKDELPRLAAALIGCSYDELMNRRRAYQMQRITVLGLILVSLALGFSGYMVYNTKKLEKSYRETLQNQSIYLANESKRLFSEEHRVEATQLALAALPSEEDDRPVTAQAIRALTDATLAYRPLSGNSIEPVWSFKADAKITNIFQSPDNKIIGCMDSLKRITMWDAKSHKELFKKDFTGSWVYSVTFVSDEEFLVLTDYELFMFSVSAKNKLWSYDYPESSFRSTDPTVMPDGKSFYVVTQNKKLLHISSEDGTLLDEFQLPLMYEDVAVDYAKILLSPDGKSVAVVMEDNETCHVGLLDMSDGSIKVMDAQMPNVRDMIFLDDHTVAVAEYDFFSFSNMYYNERKLLKPISSVITCMDFSTMQKRWTNEFVYNEYCLASEFLILEQENSLLYYCGDRMAIYDIDSGEEKAFYDTNEIVVHINDNDGDGVPVFVTKDGGIGMTISVGGENALTLTRELIDHIDFVKVGGGIYVVAEGSNEILCYDVHVSDEEWKEIDDDVVIGAISSAFFDDNYLVIGSDSEEHYAKITAYDTRKEKLLFQIGFENCAASACSILGIYDDELYVAIRENYSDDSIVKISMKKGEILEKEAVPCPTFMIYEMGNIDGKYLTYIAHDEDEDMDLIRVRNLDSGKEKEIALPEDLLRPSRAPRSYADGQYAYYCGMKGKDFIINVEEEDYYEVDLPDNWQNSTIVVPDSKCERWIIADQNHVIIFNNDGSVLHELQCNSLAAVGAYFYKEGTSSEQILIVFADGHMARYDSKTGDFIGDTEIEACDITSFQNIINVYDDQNMLCITSGSYTDIIDTESWVEVAVVYNSFGYNAPSDKFFAFSNTGNYDYRIGTFRHYTLEDLKAKAYDFLGDAELSEEQKSQYGIG